MGELTPREFAEEPVQRVARRDAFLEAIDPRRERGLLRAGHDAPLGEAAGLFLRVAVETYPGGLESADDAA